MSDESTSLVTADVAAMPARDLLKLADELFAELMSAPGELTDTDRDRVQVLRMALAEVGDRAARIFPVPKAACSCLCGKQFATAEELDEHFWAMLVPADDIVLDGRGHAEVLIDEVH
jgi:hypothetical protein